MIKPQPEARQADFFAVLEGWDVKLRRGLYRDNWDKFFPKHIVLLPREHPESWQAKLKALLIKQGKWPPPAAK